MEGSARMLGAKERALLLALSETEYCTSGTLAKALGVSSKTAQGMVKNLREKLQKNGADILARTRHGYLLQVNDRARFEALCSGKNAAAQFIPSGSEERVRYLLVLLLSQVDYVKLDDMSEELYVSKYTISGDLHQVEEELAKYHLSILRRPNYGIRVTGREIDIRNCTAHVLANYNNMMPDGGAGYRNMAQCISQCSDERDAQVHAAFFRDQFPQSGQHRLCNHPPRIAARIYSAAGRGQRTGHQRECVCRRPLSGRAAGGTVRHPSSGAGGAVSGLEYCRKMQLQQRRPRG